MDNGPAPIKIYDLNKLALWTPSPVNQGKNARLTWGIRDGNPRITVFTGQMTENKMDGILTAAMDAVTFDMFVDFFTEILETPEKAKGKLECLGRRYVDNQPTQDRVLKSTLYFGKDEEGIAWISVHVEGRPEIVFKFGVSDWHKFYKGDGTLMNPSEVSCRAALAHIKLAQRLFAPFIEEAIRNPVNYKERTEEWKKAGNGKPYNKPAPNPAPAPAEAKKETSTFDSMFEDIPL